MSARWCVELADDGSNFGGIRTEIRELLTAMSVIREELAAIRTDILWLKNITGGFQGDIDELKALIGDVFVPTVKVGKQNQRGFDSAAWHNLLDLAGYPKSSGKPGAGK